MSLITPSSSVPSPAKKYIQWSGKRGCFSYYDRDKGEAVDLPLPFEFAVLENYYSVDGMNSDDERIYSNKFKNFGTDVVSINMGTRVPRLVGYYADIKDAFKAQGARLTNNLFSVVDGEIVCIQIKGSALAALSESNINIDKHTVVVKESVEKKNKKGTWLNPVFENGGAISADDYKTPIEEAMPYFDYINGGIKKVVPTPSATIEETTAPSTYGVAEEPGFDDEVKVENLPF